MLTRGDVRADEDLLRQRLEQAIRFRDSLAIDATACRLVHGEADLLPSLIVDRYGDYLVLQALSQGMVAAAAGVAAWCRNACAMGHLVAEKTLRAQVPSGYFQVCSRTA